MEPEDREAATRAARHKSAILRWFVRSRLRVSLVVLALLVALLTLCLRVPAFLAGDRSASAVLATIAAGLSGLALLAHRWRRRRATARRVASSREHRPLRPGPADLTADADDVMTLVAAESPAHAMQFHRELLIGRSARADVQVTHDLVSRLHARIYREADAWHVQDLDSRSGTYLNGKMTAAAKLTDGDVIKIGDATFEIGTKQIRFHATGGPAPLSDRLGEKRRAHLRVPSDDVVACPNCGTRFNVRHYRVSAVVRVRCGRCCDVLSLDFTSSEPDERETLLRPSGPADDVDSRKVNAVMRLASDLIARFREVRRLLDQVERAERDADLEPLEMGRLTASCREACDHWAYMAFGPLRRALVGGCTMREEFPDVREVLEVDYRTPVPSEEWADRGRAAEELTRHLLTIRESIAPWLIAPDFPGEFESPRGT